ncbi:regulatory protein RecX [Gryllotalpicola protaetiae]|uniref:Regulatory protein RecX n=1 Tax=Gryllotalpicola protaetiae TaxID=2419771 RepID=A0A387C203_9MICO|nr:regulatory protein RecX [Gryllotalpicola protaetiae]AYG04541.1 regulatory protein RecX [Gryllotalpicola protaetiae]
MVVRFFPSDDERASGVGAGRRRVVKHDGRPAGQAAIAYLPGAAPTERAQAAAAAVRSVAEADAAAEQGTAEGALGRVREKAGKRAANVSLHQLARRGMSRWELEQVLRKREVDEAVAEAELDRLESVGLLDDGALAVSLVYAARARKGQGRQAIERELRRRHIDDDAIFEALADYDQEDELDQAIEVALKRVAQLHDLDDQTAERRLYGYLQRRGYSGEAVCIAVGDAMRSRHESR